MRVVDLIAAVLAVMFVAAAASKAVAQRRSDRPVLPGVRARGLVWLVVTAEFVVGAVLLLAPRPGAVLGAILLFGFTIALGILRRTYPGEPCRCFGSVSEHPIGISDFLRNLGMLGACFWILLA